MLLSTFAEITLVPGSFSRAILTFIGSPVVARCSGVSAANCRCATATMVASDGSVPIFGEANPHPRSYGTFARVLGQAMEAR